MPYWNELAKKNHVVELRANVGPEIGNYFLMTAGVDPTSSLDDPNDWSGSYAGQEITKTLTGAGKTWRVYAQSLPSIGYVGEGSYPYLKRHNPFAYFNFVQKNPKQTANILPLQRLSIDSSFNALPDFSFVVPDAEHSGLNCSVALKQCSAAIRAGIADKFLRNAITELTSAIVSANTVVIVVFDAAEFSGFSENSSVPMVIIGGPQADIAPYTHSFEFVQQFALQTLGIPNSNPKTYSTRQDSTQQSRRSVLAGKNGASGREYQLNPGTQSTAQNDNGSALNHSEPLLGAITTLSHSYYTALINSGDVVTSTNGTQVALSSAGEDSAQVNGLRSSPSLNAIRFVDQFGSLAAAYNDLPATGGTVMIPPEYSEVMSTDLIIDKPNSGFVCVGDCAIEMGTHQVIVPAGTNGVFFEGMVSNGGYHGLARGFQFSYSGTSAAFVVGDSSVSTRNFRFNNISVRLAGAAGATGIALNNTIYFQMMSSAFSGNGTGGTFGIKMDGTGNFTGTGTILNPEIGFLGTGIWGDGGMNAVTIIGGTIQPQTGASGVGIDIEGGDANYILGTDLESCGTAIKLGYNAVNNLADVRLERNALDVSAGSGSTHNTIYARNQYLAGQFLTKTDAGTDNRITAAADANSLVESFSINLSPTDLPVTSCDSSNRGMFVYRPGGEGVKDSIEVCSKDAANVFAWRTY